jgi:hypothetical protein
MAMKAYGKTVTGWVITAELIEESVAEARERLQRRRVAATSYRPVRCGDWSGIGGNRWLMPGP